MMYPYPGYCATGLTELTEVSGTGMNVLISYRTYRSFGYGYERLTNFQKFQLRVLKSYETSRTSGYCGTGVQNFQKFRAGINMLSPYPGSLWHRRTELPELPGTGMSVLQKLQKFIVG